MNSIGMVAAIIGLGISLYLTKQRTGKKKLACPRKGGCEKVVSSVYGTFLGFHNDILGAIYFTTALILIPLSTFDMGALFLLKSAAIVSFLYAVYLIFVQSFVVRAWCMWCTLSAAMVITILFTVFKGY